MTRLRLFGHPALESRDSSEPLGLPLKAVVMTALIAAQAERPLAREWLAQKLWPDLDPSLALGKLRRKLHEALSIFGRDAFVITRQSVQWNRNASIEIDIVRFDELQRDDPAAALDLYGGELCSGIDDDALEEPRLRYRFRYEQLLRRLLDDARRSQDRSALRVWLRRAIAFDPFDEDAVRELMRLEADAGNRAAALREYTALCNRMRSELDTEPQAHTATLFAELAAEHTLPQRVPLAATTSFVGREREVARIAAGLRDAKVVTILGPGGIGKTRLAARCCADFASQYPGGVYFADLESSRSETDVWERLTRALAIEAGADPRAAALRFVRDRNALVVLDTCEHVPDAARSVSETLSASDSLRVLATSRKRLRIPGSIDVELAPLEIPPPQLAADDSPLRYSAYRLFVERAALVNPAFRIEENGLAAVHDLLRNVDGLPLAIELVASRAAVLGIRALRSRLAQSLRSMHSSRKGRGETLHATIAWSYDLLTSPARDLFCRLGIFRAPFSAEDAEALSADDGTALEFLLELVDASLVSVVPSGQPRYRLLETTRDFAYDVLRGRNNFESIVRVYVECFARKADALAATPDADFSHIVDDVLGIMPDFAAAMQHAAQRGWGSLGVRFLDGLYRFAMRHHARSEISRRARALYENGAIDPPLRARIARRTASVVENNDSEPFFIAAIDYYRSTGDNERLADALNGYAATRYLQHRYDECERLLLEARDRLEGSNDRLLLLKTLVRLGTLYTDYERCAAALLPPAEELIALGELRQAAQLLRNVAATAFFAKRYEDTLLHARRALDLTSVTSELGMQINLHSMRGCALTELDDIPGAARAHLDANALIPALGECFEVAEALQDAVATMTAAGKLDESARAIGFAERVRETSGVPTNAEHRKLLDETVRHLRSKLGTRYDALFWAGTHDTAESAGARVREALHAILDEAAKPTRSEVSPRRRSSSARAG